MKTLFALISVACFSSVYADVVPYNLCADKTKTDCEALHMPSLGQIDSAAGHQTATCGAGCPGDAAFKASLAVSYLLPKAADVNYAHYVAYEANSQNLVYIQPNPAANTFERIIPVQENNYLTLKYCTFSSNNIVATVEDYKKTHNVQAGVAVIDMNNYNELKTAFQAVEDSSFCDELK